jgi:hypothetical protein
MIVRIATRSAWVATGLISFIFLEKEYKTKKWEAVGGVRERDSVSLSRHASPTSSTIPKSARLTSSRTLRMITAMTEAMKDVATAMGAEETLVTTFNLR